MAAFVLVHGAFHGAWCYARVAKALRAQGHDVFIPVLSGVGERAHLAGLAINLSTHVQDVVEMLVHEDLKDVVLCGHSYAGMVITGVADQVSERVRTLFYLDAAVPEDGQSLLDLRGSEAALAVLASAGETGTSVPPVSAANLRVNDQDAAWVDSSCTSHPLGCFVQKLRLTGQEALVKHRTYVLSEQYGSSAARATFERVRDLPGWRVISMDCGHNVMIDEPELLTALLLEELER